MRQHIKIFQYNELKENYSSNNTIAIKDGSINLT